MFHASTTCSRQTARVASELHYWHDTQKWCGDDASAVDPLGVCMLSSEDFRWMTRQGMTLADRHCQGRIVVTHEGGYSPVYVPYCGLAVLEELSGASDALPDPYADFIANYGGQALSNDQAAAIKRAKDAHFSS